MTSLSMKLCRWGTWRYRLVIRKWVFSPLLPLHTLRESCPATLIRNELDRHESQHMLDEEERNAALLSVLSEASCSVSTCHPEYLYTCVIPLCVWKETARPLKPQISNYPLLHLTETAYFDLLNKLIFKNNEFIFGERRSNLRLCERPQSSF